MSQVETVEIEVVRLPHGRDLALPDYATEAAAGADLLAAIEGDIELRPGHYTVIGTREGYREVRHDITVSPGEQYLTVNIICSEPI